MREIVFDTETTGLDPLNGDRVVEIGCVELVNRVPTGRTFHAYINPQRDMPRGAFEVHGLSAEFLSDNPLFAEVAEKFCEFIGVAEMIAHNAMFDVRFLNAELEKCGGPVIEMHRVSDTLAMARQKVPGAQNSLDALCKRFTIDTSRRTLHGALLDSELLAEVYLELTGGRQAILDLVDAASGGLPITERAVEPPRPHQGCDAEYAAHAAFIAGIEDAIWTKA
jgi:DNA polymerase-3 subunit epsilon